MVLESTLRATVDEATAVQARINALRLRIRQLEDEDVDLEQTIKAIQATLAAVRPSGTCSRAPSTRPHSAAATNLALQR